MVSLFVFGVRLPTISSNLFPVNTFEKNYSRNLVLRQTSLSLTRFIGKKTSRIFMHVPSIDPLILWIDRPFCGV